MQKVIKILIFVILISGALEMSNINAAGIKDGQMIKIWPKKAPGSESLNLKEEIIERSSDPAKIKDRAVVKIIDPSLTVYLPENPNGTAILVIPGGAYERVVIDKEADELSPWLKSLGITYFVLRYRLPGEGHKNRSDVPLQDAQRALRLIRKNAAEWGIDPNRIGVMGFSAGGHNAASLAVKQNIKIYEPVDETDAVSAKPDFLILGYPVISMNNPLAHVDSRNALLGDSQTDQIRNDYSPDLLVTKDTPKTFIMHASNDSSVPVQNSINFYMALKKANVQTEMHIFMDGGHGYSIRFTKGKTCENWTKLCGDWLKSIGMIK